MLSEENRAALGEIVDTFLSWALQPQHKNAIGHHLGPSLGNLSAPLKPLVGFTPRNTKSAVIVVNSSKPFSKGEINGIMDVILERADIEKHWNGEGLQTASFRVECDIHETIIKALTKNYHGRYCSNGCNVFCECDERRKLKELFVKPKREEQDDAERTP